MGRRAGARAGRRSCGPEQELGPALECGAAPPVAGDTPS
eukprot:COSAG06_NODE_2657_length_6487_cov_26.036788_1_plen_38_part_10